MLICNRFLIQLRKSLEFAEIQITQLTTKKRIILANLNQEKEALLQQRLELEGIVLQDKKKLQQIEIDLEKSLIRSPVTGIILELNLSNEEQFVNVNDLIAEIIPQNVELNVKTIINNQILIKSLLDK